MAFSTKQVQALRRHPSHAHIRTREINGRELTYLEGWFAISEANRIFGFDGWSRETVESRCVLARENRGTFLAVYLARVRVTVHADGTTIVREGHGTGEGRGSSPGEVHDIALKAAETDATKRALATFGKPFGLELYRSGRAQASQKPHPSPSIPVPADARFGFHRTTRPNPAAVQLLRPTARPVRGRALPGGAAPYQPTSADGCSAAGTSRNQPPTCANRQKSARASRAQAVARQGTPEVCRFAALSCLRTAAVRSAPSAVCPA